MVGHSRKPDSGYKLTQHSHYKRIRIGNWRIQCKLCKAVFTVLLYFVLRYQSMSITIARQSLFALYGGLSAKSQAGLNGFVLLYNFVPYQRRAKNAGQCSSVQVEKGHLPREDWFLSLQILTVGGFR